MYMYWFEYLDDDATLSMFNLHVTMQLSVYLVMEDFLQLGRRATERAVSAALVIHQKIMVQELENIRI